MPLSTLLAIQNAPVTPAAPVVAQKKAVTVSKFTTPKRYPRKKGRTDWEMWQRVANSAEAKLYMSAHMRLGDKKTPGNGAHHSEVDPRKHIEVIESRGETFLTFVRYVHKTRLGIINVDLSRQHETLFFAQIVKTSGMRMTSKVYDYNDMISFTAGVVPRDGSILAFGNSLPYWPTVDHEKLARYCLTMTPIVVQLDDGSIQLEFPSEGYDSWMRVRILCQLGAPIPMLPDFTGEEIYDYEEQRQANKEHDAELAQARRHRY